MKVPFPNDEANYKKLQNIQVTLKILIILQKNSSNYYDKNIDFCLFSLQDLGFNY